MFVTRIPRGRQHDLMFSITYRNHYGKTVKHALDGELDLPGDLVFIEANLTKGLPRLAEIYNSEAHGLNGGLSGLSLHNFDRRLAGGIWGPAR